MRSNNEVTVQIGRIGANWIGYSFETEKRALSVELEIEFQRRDKGLVLSISGGVWNPRRTDYVTCGQIDDQIREWLLHGKFVSLNYPYKTLVRLLKIWRDWHLNDMHAECVHQEKLLPKVRQERGDKFFYADNLDQIWSVPEFAKCPECGYKYGTAWTYRSIPADVIAFMVQNFRAKLPVQEGST